MELYAVANENLMAQINLTVFRRKNKGRFVF